MKRGRGLAWARMVPRSKRGPKLRERGGGFKIPGNRFLSPPKVGKILEKGEELLKVDVENWKERGGKKNEKWSLFVGKKVQTDLADEGIRGEMEDCMEL